MATKKSPSSALRRLQELPQAQAEVYARYRLKFTQAHNDPYIPPELKARAITALQAQLREELAELKEKRVAAEQELAGRMSWYGQGSTAVAKEKVKWSLEHGFDLHSLAQQLASEGDRQGLSALREFIPYGLKSGMIDAPDGLAEHKRAQYVAEIIATYEKQTWSAEEQAIAGELAAAQANSGFLSKNERDIEQWAGQMHLSQAPQRYKVEQLLHFQTPDGDGPKGYFNPDPQQSPERPRTWMPGALR